ncbi:hypothetical protein INT45_012988 [Circinella minor]|uniref:Uncharacterized protein n=1 Tax=Circinella minor TaxID=1195481 RepID=A0A8H7VJH6_9FUNG|nr:hypothetical protein INT45_012988 [Circinella minor]
MKYSTIMLFACVLVLSATYSSIAQTIAKRQASGDCPECGTSAIQSCGRHGCYDGYCWSECLGFGHVANVVALNEWCYTTKGRSQDFNYVRCTTDEECCPSWSCAGACAASPSGPI